MVKRIILEIILIVITVLVVICGYFLILDIESNVPQELRDKVEIDTKEFMERKVFEISPKNKEDKSNKTILYFHGGAYVAEATDEHWNFLAKLVNDTKATVIMPDYPLTPKYTYKDVLKMIEPVYKETLAKVGAKNLIVMGDSAGGGMALGLLEKLSQSNVEMPAKTILISPWLDTTMSNSKIDEVQKNDKDLNKEKLYLAGTSYSRDLKQEEEYFVNPINGKFSKLKNLVIYTGTYDILNPDCHLLKEKAEKEGVDITIKEYETAPHIWIVNNEDELAISAYNDLISSLLN
ncbi:MAG: alpha/beta hydrolase [Clostridia bacterium]|nr:alpha/beta hydrolase [Clostridia bacterium]